MNIRNIAAIATTVLLHLLTTGCKKEYPNIFNMFRVKLTLHQSKDFAVGADGKITINDADSVLIDYTLESPDADMYQIALYKTGGIIPSQKIPITNEQQRRTYSGQFKLYAKDMGAGLSSYRIWPLDKDGVYLGDGDKLISITVNTNMQYFDNRRLFVPDSLTKENTCYLSLSDGSLYSYTTGSKQSEKIDLGIYKKGTGDKDSVFIYAPAATPLPFDFYDISSWTKRTTLFSAPVSGNVNNFNTMFNTAYKIELAAKAQTINLTSIAKPAEASQFIYFKTQEGKYGVMMIVAKSSDYRGFRYLQVSIKKQP